MKMQKYATFVNKSLKINLLKIKNIVKLYRWTRGAAHSICNLKYSIPKEITVIFRNGSNYGHHSIIKELREEFEGQFTCLRENAERYVTFPVLITKEVKRIDKNREEITKTVSCKLNSLSVQDLWQAHYQILSTISLKKFIKLKVNMDMLIKYVKHVKLKYKDCKCCLEYTNNKNDLIEYKCLCCNKNYEKTLD